jgi:hypothetical protein
MEKIETGGQEIMIDENIDFIDTMNGKKNRALEAKDLINSSQELVWKVDSDINECKVGISQATVDFDTQKRTFINETFKNSEELLKKVGIEYGVSSESHRLFELSLDSMNKSRLIINDINSGRFTGTILAIITALLTLFGWLYFAVKQLNISLESVNVKMIENNIPPVLEWIGSTIGVEGQPMVGASILGLSILSMAWLVYALRVHFRTNKNLRIAKKAFIESREYSFVQDGCKKEILGVDGHLRESIVSIENFGFLLTEQNAILKRVIHVEGLPSAEGHSYHPNSKKVIRNISRLMKSIEDLLNTSITKNGVLNPESQKALSISTAVYDDFIARMYE